MPLSSRSDENGRAYKSLPVLEQQLRVSETTIADRWSYCLNERQRYKNQKPSVRELKTKKSEARNQKSPAGKFYSERQISKVSGRT